MVKGVISKPASPDSSSFDSRRSQRETRSRPWLTNSILRGQSTADSSSGVNGSLDAPKLPVVTTVAIVPDPLPTETISCGPEKQRKNITKIPRWVGLSALSQPCGSKSLDGEGKCGKDKYPAISPIATGEFSASRIPVSIGKSFAGRRSASPQIRPSEPPVGHAVSSTDNEVGKKRGTGGSRAMFRFFRRKDTGAPIQSCFKAEPIKSHRLEVTLKPILKHRPERSEEASLAAPATSTSDGQGVTSQPIKEIKEAKKVRVISQTFPTPPRHWGPIGARLHQCCGDVRCDCPGEDRGKIYTVKKWLEDQLLLGHDYLELSGGLLGGNTFPLPDSIGSESVSSFSESDFF